MGGLALVVDQRGARLEAGNHDTVVLTTPDGRRERVGIRALGAVVLNGDVMISTSTLRKLAAERVAVTLLPVRGLSASVGFTALPERATRLRHAQHLTYANPRMRMMLARTVVIAKLGAQDFAASRLGQTFAAGEAVAAAGRATTIAGLMGVEGAAAAEYFQTLRRVVAPDFAFCRRSRRPPRDPVNALLSLGYTLAQSAMAQMALRFGLDVYVGFLHGIAHQRQSLALDLLEAVRPVVDAWTLSTLGVDDGFTPADFASNTADGCRLEKEARQRFYRRWFAEVQPDVARAARPLLAQVLVQLRSVPVSFDAEEGDISDDCADCTEEIAPCH